MNKYSLNAESYGISKLEWSKIKNEVIKDSRDSNFMIGKHQLGRKQTWFLYDVLLQEKYNHLYYREKLVEPKLNDYVYCDYEGFGRGTIVKLFEDGLMLVKFNKRDFPTMCSSINMVTIFDDIKRKITKI